MTVLDKSVPLVSIVIPNYNYAKYIPTAVRSLVQQTHSRIELIIVDDGSRDDSREVINFLKVFYQDRLERFESLSLKKNKGRLHAINKGIPLVRGEITVILDADDYFDQKYIEDLVHFLLASQANNDKIAFVYTDCWLVDSVRQPLGIGRSTTFDKTLLQISSYIPGCAPTFTRILQEVLPFEESIRVGTKHHIWKRIVNAGWEGTYLRKPFFYYRIHDQNLSGIGKRLLKNVDRAKPKMHTLSSLWPTTHVR